MRQLSVRKRAVMSYNFVCFAGYDDIMECIDNCINEEVLNEIQANFGNDVKIVIENSKDKIIEWLKSRVDQCSIKEIKLSKFEFENDDRICGGWADAFEQSEDLIESINAKDLDYNDFRYALTLIASYAARNMEKLDSNKRLISEKYS